jgi:hypothetical protein
MNQNEFDLAVRELPALVPIKQAASFLHSHPQTVRNLLSSGELVGTQRRARQGSPIVLTRDSIAAYLSRHQR